MKSRAKNGDVMLTCAVMTSHVYDNRWNCSWLLEDREITTSTDGHTVWSPINNQWHLTLWQLTIARPTGALAANHSN